MPLAEAVSHIRSQEEADEFLRAILSKVEREKVETRWRTFQLKGSGLTHRQTVDIGNTSMSTVSRVAALNDSEKAILNLLLSRGNKK